MRKLLTFLYQSVLISGKKTIKTAWLLFKIMIPVSILIKILQETGLIVYVGNVFSPLMSLVGLPGEMGLVFGTGVISNIFGGLIAFSSIYQNVPLTVAQVTILASMILVAHNFLIEITVAFKAGVKMLPMILTRLGGAFLLGILLHLFYSSTNTLQEPIRTIAFVPTSANNSLFAWAITELKKYGGVIIVIFALVFLLEILKKIGIIQLFTKALTPVMRFLGINPNVIPITIIGMTLGLAYGGALIVGEVKDEKISKKDIFYSLFLMGILHSVIEDSLLMLSIGAHYSGVIIFRALLAFILTFFVVYFTRNWSNAKMKRYFVR